MKQRVIGYDLARALALFGMVIVNFKVAMNAETGYPFLMSITTLLEGRASALFVMLAGVGITFLTAKARHSVDNTLVFKTRISIIKRGLLLVIIGLIFTPIWEADILHFYGFYFLFAAAIFMFQDKFLLWTSMIIMIIFPVLMLLFNFEQNWDWETLAYNNFWSVDGMIRHIFFNGFHPVFPWAAFLTFGMWLGRQDLSLKLIRKKLFFGAMVTLVITECSFYYLRNILNNIYESAMTAEEITFLFSTSIIPPLPQYIISAGSSAVLVLITCLYLSERFSETKVTQYLYQTGQLSLTFYMAHIVIGMGFLESIGRLENQSIDFSLLSALIFCAGAIAFSVVWLKFLDVGPLEWVFRKVAK
ncbi:MAG: hypothetical protein ACI936_000814 [Paraglaciecola sp.]|jgi:uncharacterized membrane protein YeiB